MPWRGMPSAEGMRNDLDRPVGQPDNAIARDARPALGADDLEERVCALRVELRARAALDLGHGVGHRQGASIDPVLGHRMEGVADADDARAERDLVGLEALGIARAVPAL